jgi:hypothetical protein
MPEPLPLLVYDEHDAEGNLVSVDLRQLEPWRADVIQFVKLWAGEILTASDWRVVKAFETATPMAAEYASARQLVRDTTSVAVAQLTAAASLADIDAVGWASAFSALDTNQTTFTAP